MRKRTKRTVYKLIDPIAHAIIGACVTDKTNLDKLRLMELTAIDAIRRGGGSLNDYRTLADMLNLCERMAIHGIGPEALDVCQAFTDELAAMAKRFEQTRKMVFTGTGLRLAQEVFEFHDLQRQSITRAKYAEMLQKTHDYIRSNNQNVVNIS